jgi:hypothetical protein
VGVEFQELQMAYIIPVILLKGFQDILTGLAVAVAAVASAIASYEELALNLVSILRQ